MSGPHYNADTICPENFFSHYFSFHIWYFVTKIVLTCCEKNCSFDLEKVLKFEAEGQEFAKLLRSLEQFIETAKGQNNLW